jgi:hypothetical protein
MGHPQSKTPVHCNNATAVGIVSNTIKRQHLQSMEMRFFWIGDKVSQEMYALKGHPGQENLADSEQTSHWLSPRKGETLVLAFRKSPPGITTGREA